MDPVLNPFVPGAGAQPPELAGREGLLEQARIALARTQRRRAAKNLIATGLRGTGKTVLLQRIRSITGSESSHSCFAEAHGHESLAELLIPQLRQLILDLDRLGALNEQVKRGLRVLKSFMSCFKLNYADLELELDITPETGAADSGSIEHDLTELFIAVGRAAAARDVGVALMIDEMQFLAQRDLAALIMALHQCVQQALPVVLIGAGLPQILYSVGRAKSYAERMFEFLAVGPLCQEEAFAALQAPARRQNVSWTDAAMEAIWQYTEGYPYFVQEWGYHSWNIATGPTIDRDDVENASKIAFAQLDANFFQVRFGRLTDRERRYLRVMADLGPGPHASAAIADRFGLRVQALSSYRNRLIEKGLIYSPEHGVTAFSVPLFDRFMKRNMPDWKPHG